jgi:N-acetylglucosaminyl-diphospho-decaprenol L-rhamnosyltransferase
VQLTIDVVIPTYNGWPLLERCLELLRAQTIAHRVIVVDNGSTDGTPARVRRAFPEAFVVELPENVGFPAACNRAAAIGDGDVIVLLNNDVEVPSTFLEELVRPLVANEAVGSVASVLLRRDGNSIDSVGLCVDRTLAGFPRLRGEPLAESGSLRPLLVGPAGGAGAYRRVAWTAVEGLDEGVFGYGEDVELAVRLAHAGWAAAAATAAIAIHLGSASFGRRSSWQRYQGGFSRGYFVRRYGLRATGIARTIATEAVVIAGDAIISRDLSALRGRVAGWRAARDAVRRPPPPAHAVDQSIGFFASLRMRRGIYRS